MGRRAKDVVDPKLFDLIDVDENGEQFNWLEETYLKPKTCKCCGKKTREYSQWQNNEGWFCSYNCMAKYSHDLRILREGGEHEIFNPSRSMPWLDLSKLSDSLLSKLNFTVQYKFYCILNEDPSTLTWLKTSTSSKQLNKYFKMFKDNCFIKFGDNYELGVVAEVYDQTDKTYQLRLSRQIEKNYNEFRDYWYKIKDGIECKCEF